jgi:hypothetical protein
MSRRGFADYACASNCSGHEAGYKWAEEHDIDDIDDGDAAGDHSNSPSFAKGCRAFVEGLDDLDNSGLSDESDSEPKDN